MRERTASSTKTLPFFFPVGASTPTGVIVLSFGIPSSSSVYVRGFFFLGTDLEDLVFCCFGGGAFELFDTRDFAEVERRELDLPDDDDDDGLFEPLETCFERTVFVGAI